MNLPNAPIDLDAISKRNGETVLAYLKLTLMRQPGDTPDPVEASALMKGLVEALKDASILGAEVEKLRRQRQKVRDIHAPENSSDPSAPGAYCTGCSLHGARVMWPCPTFKATQDEQAPGFGGLL